MAVHRICRKLLSLRNRRLLAVLALVLILGIVLRKYQGHHRTAHAEERRTYQGDKTTRVPAEDTAPPVSQACVLPRLELNYSDIMQYFRHENAINCSDGAVGDWVYVDQGKFRVLQLAQDHYGDITCNYTPVHFHTDFKVGTGPKFVDMKDGDYITSDFFKVECSSKAGKTYENIHASVATRQDLLDRKFNTTLASDSLGLDVLMFGFDSVSKMTWLRALPKTRDYFVNTLGGLELDGYNILGDGTPAALLPILTDQTEEELPEARRGHEGAKPVDGHPWIWKEFRDQGYVTMWGEDMASVGTFQYRMLGFEKPPVDHYMRPFQLAAANYIRKSDCLGFSPQVKAFFNWFRDAATLYGSRRKFMFGFHSFLSHNDNSPLQKADVFLFDFLKFLAIGHHLENTLLILMSDHGARFSKIRNSAQGKLEERMPYFSFRFPPWFESKYPDAMRNFRTNLQRLTTPFDIHATLKDVLHFSGAGVGNMSSRGISLFKEVPKERTCADADVAPHWCACLTWETVDQNDPVVKMVARTAVAAMNKWTQSVRDRCAELSLSKVVSAGKFSPQRDVLRFKQTSDKDGRVADLSGDTKVDVVLYQLTILTDPNGGRYEVTLRLRLASLQATLDPTDVSRTNKYGSAPDCVAQELPHLRPYCFCKSASAPSHHAKPHAV